jgi:hypothetical protein
MSVCVYSVFLLVCVKAASLRRADPRPRSLTDCVKKGQEIEKATKAQQGDIGWLVGWLVGR